MLIKAEDDSLHARGKRITNERKAKRQKREQKVEERRRPTKSTSISMSLDDYAVELVNIGTLRPNDPYYGKPGYDSTFNTTGKERARAIGRRIYAEGGHDSMVKVANKVVYLMGQQVAIELEHCWNGIGDWLA